jgi:hypothetical protein
MSSKRLFPWRKAERIRNEMNEKMDRKQIEIGTIKELEKSDNEYWSRASVEEKLKTITYLRECFYGPEATTGRLQRLHKIIKRT